MRWLSYRIFTALGWRVEGELPDVPKMVIIGAPHTSNWDFFLFLAVIYHFGIKVIRLFVQLGYPRGEREFTKVSTY